MSQDIHQEADRAAGDVKTIFRRYRRNPKTGEILDARRFGIRAWPIHIRHKPKVSEMIVDDRNDSTV